MALGYCQFPGPFLFRVRSLIIPDLIDSACGLKMLFHFRSQPGTRFPEHAFSTAPAPLHLIKMVQVLHSDSKMVDFGPAGA